MKKEFSGEYLAPEVKVIEFRSREAILQVSPSGEGDSEQYGEGDTSGWF